MPTPTLIYWMQRLPHVQCTNLYGPTEATIASSYYTVPAVPAHDRAPIPIGTACSGEQLVVLDEQRAPAPVGEIGDLYIAGEGLSPGYWKDPDKTAAVFVPDHADPSRLLYRTGDLARVDGEGLIYFLGRSDSQIKSRGYRIELGEIETALNALPYVAECAVVGVDSGGFEGTLICCAFALAPDSDASPVSIRRALTASLPSYMLPARWKAYGQLPKNANGKIDKRTIRESFEHDKASPSQTESPMTASA
jgi:acyl-coenzyme A synthetase/AMP-(fatty) acid ligase